MAALVVYWFVGVLPRVGPTVSFPGADLVFQFSPDYVHVAERLRAGEVAPWNPFHGQPLLATLLPGALYPG